MTTLDQLNPGDEVAIVSGCGGWTKLARVDTVSMVHLRAAGHKFDRMTGAVIGNVLDRAFGFRATPPTDDLRRSAWTREIREATHGLTLDQLRRIRAIIEEPKP